MRNIVLIGFMGAGKTAIGKRMAKALGREFIDLDAFIERETGRSIAEIFKVSGEVAFRSLEREFGAKAAQGGGKVIATGGGFVTSPPSIEGMRENSLFLYLRVDPEVGFERVSRTSHRPLLKTENPKETYMTLLEKRLPLYERYADAVIDSGRGPFEKVLSKALFSVEGLSE